MHAFKLKHPVPELQPIGSVSLLGATPTAGDPQVAGGDDLRRAAGCLYLRTVFVH